MTSTHNFAAAGATGASWLHLVDLDAAFAENRAISVVERIPGISGILSSWEDRDLEQIRAALNAGVARVIIGTAAVTNPSWWPGLCLLWGERIVVKLCGDALWLSRLAGSLRAFLDVAGEMQGGCVRVWSLPYQQDGMLAHVKATRTGEKDRLK